MSSIWYVGGSDVRIVRSEDWDDAGVDDTTAFRWDAYNGYSYDQGLFTAQQVAWLRSQNDFMVDAPDGPRTVVLVPADGYITESRLREILAGVDFSGLGLTKSSIGLSQVDNTADSAKPVSALQQVALSGKIDYPASGTDGQVLIKTGASASWAAPSGGGSVGVAAVADTYWASGSVYNITGTGVAAVTDSFWPSGTVYTVN